jgi:hypothetical protein
MGLVVLEALQLAGITQGFKRRGVPSTRFGDGGRMDTGEVDKDGESLSIEATLVPSLSFSFSIVACIVFLLPDGFDSLNEIGTPCLGQWTIPRKFLFYVQRCLL